MSVSRQRDLHGLASIRSTKGLAILLGSAAVVFSAMPISFDGYNGSAAYASSHSGNSATSGSQGSGGGNSDTSGNSNSGESGGGKSDSGGSGKTGGQGLGGTASDDDQDSDGSEDNDASGGAQHQSSGSHGGTEPGSGGQQGEYTDGQQRGQGGAADEPDFSDIIKDIAGDDDSDRPDWAGEPGGKDGVGGGQPPTSGSKKGDLFGDLWVIARDDNGVPILTPEGWVQPIDEDGNLIPLDEEGHPLDENATLEVELGRLNVGRAPTQVLDRRADEVITLMNTATDLTTDAAGRLVFTIDDEQKTIDSPLENLAIYAALLTSGTIPGVDDLPGTAFDFMVDGVYTAEDLAASAAFLAAATDKTGAFTADEIAYIDTFLGINTKTIGNVTYSDIDYSGFVYDRTATYGDVTVEVLVLQDDGTWAPEEVNVFDAVFDGEGASSSGSLEAYTLAADDARMIVNFVHEYEVPAADLASVEH